MLLEENKLTIHARNVKDKLGGGKKSVYITVHIYVVVALVMLVCLDTFDLLKIRNYTSKSL